MFQVLFSGFGIIPESCRMRFFFTLPDQLQLFIDLKETSSGLPCVP
jgi:hypothetical protein